MIAKRHIAVALTTLLVAAGAAQADSNVIGSVETNVRVNRAQQSQSGLLNKQEANLGSVSDSNVIGTVDTNVRVNRVDQNQSGLLNKQEMSVGSVD